MKRRTFLNQAALVGMGLPVWHLSGFKRANGPSEAWLTALIQDNDLQVETLLRRQSLDASSVNYGGIPDAYDLYHAGSAAGFIQRLTCSYINLESRYYKSSLLLDRMLRAAGFLRQVQHDDGSIDLLTTNFHSPPDTAFVVEPMAISMGLLQDLAGETDALLLELRKFLQKAGDILTVGGIHTPNHRWVVSMALARIHALMPDAKYTNRIGQWLGEGIDIDPDGQFTERSTAVYSPLTDRCLITIARILDRPELLIPVRRNLTMTLELLHPNGEIVTESSRRQDQYLARTPVPYYYPYLYLANQDNDKTFGAMVRQLEDLYGPKELSGYLPYLMEKPDLYRHYGLSPLPNQYRTYFPNSAMVRLRRGNWDATILRDNAALLTFQHGECVLQAVRLATSFFGKGQFVASEMAVTDDEIQLKQSLSGPYYQPIAKEFIDRDGSWEAMPREERPQSEIQTIHYACSVFEINHGIRLKIDLTGTDGVPVALELGFRKGGHLTGAGKIPNDPESFLWQDREVIYESGKDAIRITGGQLQHRWTQLRGALPKLDANCLYVTGFTPCQLVIDIEAVVA